MEQYVNTLLSGKLKGIIQYTCTALKTYETPLLYYFISCLENISLHLRWIQPLVNATYGHNLFVLWEPYGIHKHTVWTKCRDFNVKAGGTHSYPGALCGWTGVQLPSDQNPHEYDQWQYLPTQIYTGWFTTWNLRNVTLEITSSEMSRRNKTYS